MKVKLSVFKRAPEHSWMFAVTLMFGGGSLLLGKISLQWCLSITIRFSSVSIVFRVVRSWVTVLRDLIPRCSATSSAFPKSAPKSSSNLPSVIIPALYSTPVSAGKCLTCVGSEVDP